MTASHMTLGLFLAPSITVREMRLDDAQPYLPRQARARVEARIMPGQRSELVQHAVIEFLMGLLPGSTVTTSLARPPATGSLVRNVDLPDGVRELPVVAGISAGGLLESAGVPALGFSTVARDPDAEVEQIAIARIEQGTAFIVELSRRLSPDRDG